MIWLNEETPLVSAGRQSSTHFQTGTLLSINVHKNTEKRLKR